MSPSHPKEKGGKKKGDPPFSKQMAHDPPFVLKAILEKKWGIPNFFLFWMDCVIRVCWVLYPKSRSGRVPLGGASPSTTPRTLGPPPASPSQDHKIRCACPWHSSDWYELVVGNSQRGGQNVSCQFGGGKRTIKCPLQTQFWRPQKVGFVWSVPVSSKENDIAWTGGGRKSYHKWGGPKPFLGRGFMVCFPLPWGPPPFVFLWSGGEPLKSSPSSVERQP